MDITAEWPGLVKEINVGDAVDAGQELLLLESMKMLTPVAAPRAGEVATVHVSVDDYVDVGAPLVTLE